MLPPVRVWSREEMLKRVARFADLKGFSDGLQDSALPECQKTTFAVIGFQMPAEAGVGAVNSPVGQNSSANAAIPISEGFNLGFVRCKPGKGVLAQPRHERDLRRHQRQLARAMERGRGDGIARGRA
ncbi:MAG: hypothetical protein ACREVR_19330, partial [Burkholderiales bacterium]